MAGRWVRWLVTALFALMTAAALGTASPSVAAAAATGRVYVVNGVSGVTAQVLVDGAVIRDAAAPKTVIGPLTLPAGQHVLELRTAGTSLVTAQFTLAAGDSLDVVAHRAADRAMTPLITVFRNDLSPVGPGKGRLVISHVAVAEPADIRIDGKPYFRNVANAESLSIVLPTGAYSLSVVATADPAKVVLEPVGVTTKAGALTRVFAFGSPVEKTTDAVVQVLVVPVAGAGKPSAVHTGDGGQAAQGYLTSSAVGWTACAAGLVGLALAGAAGTTFGSLSSVRLTGGPRRQ